MEWNYICCRRWHVGEASNMLLENSHNSTFKSLFPSKGLSTQASCNQVLYPMNRQIILRWRKHVKAVREKLSWHNSIKGDDAQIISGINSTNVVRCRCCYRSRRRLPLLWLSEKKKKSQPEKITGVISLLATSKHWGHQGGRTLLQPTA